MNTICRPWLVMVVDKKDWQTDQFSLNDQFYDCFVCDESLGLLVTMNQPSLYSVKYPLYYAKDKSDFWIQN